MKALLSAALITTLLFASQESAAQTRDTLQAPPQIEVGQRVRVTEYRWQTVSDLRVAGSRVNRHSVGTLLAASSDTLWIRAGAITQAFQISSMDRIEVSRGRRGLAKQGMLVGGATLALFGVLVGLNGQQACFLSEECVRANEAGRPGGERALMAAGAGAAGFVIGGLVGGAVGALFKGERWVVVPIGRGR